MSSSQKLIIGMCCSPLGSLADINTLGTTRAPYETSVSFEGSTKYDCPYSTWALQGTKICDLAGTQTLLWGHIICMVSPLLSLKACCFIFWKFFSLWTFFGSRSLMVCNESCQAVVRSEVTEYFPDELRIITCPSLMKSESLCSIAFNSITWSSSRSDLSSHM